MSVAWKEKLAAAQKVLGEAQAILANENASQEEKNRIPVMIEDVKRLKHEANQLKDIEELGLELGAASSPLNKPPAGQQKQGQETESTEFKDWMDFMSSVRAVYKFGRQDKRLKTLRDPEEIAAEDGAGRQEKAMSGATGAGGGFLIPAEQLSEILAVGQMESVVRPRATKIPMSSRTLTMPVLDQTGATAGTPSWFGGILTFWAAEAAQKTESSPEWREAVLTAHKLICYTRISDELLDDAPALAAFLQGPLGLPGAIAWAEDYAFLQGTGVGQPIGVVSAPATKVVARQVAGTVGYIDLTNILAGFYGASPIWVAHKTLQATLLQMNGPVGNPVYLWGNAEKGIPNMLLGYPIVFTDRVPTLGTQGDIGLYDFRYYMIGDRKATEIKFSTDERFQYDQTALRGVHRVDGQPWLSTVLTLVDGTTTISPFVVLGDASS